jgi:hypothetical protein
MKKTIAVVVAVAACGDDGGVTVDAPQTIDAMETIDAMPPVDGRDPTPNAYVIGAVRLPSNSSEVMMFGQDIDAIEPGGDVGIDNQLGNVISALVGFGLDAQTGVTVSIDRGAAITLVYRDMTEMALETYVGANPMPPACNGPSDTTCRLHLDGHGLFEIAAGEPIGAIPEVAPGTFGSGTAVVHIVLGFGGAMPMTLELIGARFDGTIDATGFVDAKLAGAIPDEQVQSELLPAIAEGIRATVAMECTGSPPPTCGCTPSSNGEQFISLFDENQDCTITDDEVRNNAIIQSFFDPDVNIGGVDALSLGVLATGVPAAFTPP